MARLDVSAGEAAAKAAGTKGTAGDAAAVVGVVVVLVTPCLVVLELLMTGVSARCNTRGVVVTGRDVRLEFDDGTSRDLATVWLRDACRV